MTINKHISWESIEKTNFSQVITIFHGRQAPEKGSLVGYGTLIDALGLPVPLPNRLALISEKHRQYKTTGWLVFTPRHMPQDTLYGHIVFSMKYEGIDLLFFKKLFEKVNEPVLIEMIRNEPLGQYSRRIWFLYEWLMQKKLDIPDLKDGNYVPVLDDNLQYTIGKGTNSSRHRVRNNLPGTEKFCPLITKTEKLEDYLKSDLSEKTTGLVSNVHKDILLRTSSLLLLKDSKASFSIEGESPPTSRITRWGKVIGLAGTIPFSITELLRLQQMVIENSRFMKMGLRMEGGFVGEHDRITGEPIPEHISARWEDLDEILDGLTANDLLLENFEFHPVLTAAIIAFGFVFIHPFVDGNGRIHRYLIHHILAKRKFTPQGIIFPVSSAILEKMDDYRKALESYSQSILDFIEWKVTPDNNVEVLNQTVDYYRYFDATIQAEFLFDCIDYTIKKIIPEEISYLQKYDRMKTWINDNYEMPDRLVSLLIRFLSQNSGVLSTRARHKEFQELNIKEIQQIERQYKMIFGE